MALAAGTKLGVYEIVSLIGTGGTGELYRAKDTRLGRDVAIKILHSDAASDAQRRRRFEEEANAASALNHPNIITIHQIGDFGESSFIAMELREYAHLHAGGAGDIASACALAGATDDALELLEAAIELGWFSPEFWARHDQSFAYLHGDERFEKLIARARDKAAAFEE